MSTILLALFCRNNLLRVQGFAVCLGPKIFFKLERISMANDFEQNLVYIFENVVNKLKEYNFSSYCSNSQLDVVPVSKELMDCCEISSEVEHIANDTLYIPIFSCLQNHEEKALIKALEIISSEQNGLKRRN